MGAETGRDFTWFYYYDALEAFVAFLRELIPEWTETDPRDPMQAYARQIALLAHRNAAMIDLAAGELAWPTMLRRSSAIALAALVGQRLAADSPAVADVILDLVGVPGPADVVLPDLATFRTTGDAETRSIAYESTAGDVTVGNLEFTLIAYDAGTGYSAPAVGSIANPWGGGANLNEAVYIGHAVLQFDRFERALTGTPDDYTAVFEYYDGGFRAVQPDAVSLLGVGFRADVDGLLAPGQSYYDALVRVQSKITGAETVAAVRYDGTNYIEVADPLGQPTVSTDPADYEVSADWLPWGGETDAPTGATDPSRDLDVDLPQDAGHKWQPTTVGGVTAYWVRERVVEEGAVPLAPTAYAATPAAEITWTLLAETVQGQTVVDVLGITAGTAFEAFPLNESPFIEGSIDLLDVGGDADWVEVASLIASGPDDKHYVLEELPDGTRQIVGGDGATGRRFPGAVTVEATYRIGADEPGNVGAGAIGRTDAAVSFLTDPRNPRDATGWRAREADDEPGLAQVKRLVPASFRAQERAVTPDDAATLAVRTFRTADGRAPFARAVPIESGAGDKTIMLVCVGAGGTVPDGADIAELEEYFNGVEVGGQRHGGVAMANQRVIPVAYSPLRIDVTAVAKVTAHLAVGAQARLATVFTAILNALAVDADGNYRWSTNADVTEAALLAAVGAAGIPGLADLTFSAPTFPVALAAAQLPEPGGISVTVQEVS